MSNRKETRPPQQSIKMEIEINSEADKAKLKALLLPSLGEEAAEQLIFLIEQTINQKDFVNHCKDATQALGLQLLEKYGGEESFAELAPGMAYGDARSNAQLEKFGYRGGYHSVGLLCVTNEKKKVTFAIDLTYFVVNTDSKKKNSILVMKVNGAGPEATQALGEHYGGKWDVEFRLNLEKGNFEYVE